MSSIRCVPAILTDDAIDLGKMVLLTESFTDFAQFDIMDGRFVPSHSVSCEADGQQKCSALAMPHNTPILRLISATRTAPSLAACSQT